MIDRLREGLKSTWARAAARATKPGRTNEPSRRKESVDSQASVESQRRWLSDRFSSARWNDDSTRKSGRASKRGRTRRGGDDRSSLVLDDGSCNR